MVKVLHVIPSLTYSGVARQLTLLLTGLPRDRFDLRVCVLGRSGPWSEEIRAAGVPVDVLHWHRLVDLRPFLELRRLIRDFRPDLIHSWGAMALRTVAVMASRRCRLGVSGLGAMPRRKEKAPAAFWDRRLLRRAEWVTVAGPAEESRCRRIGVDSRRIVSIPPAVLPVQGKETPAVPHLPAGARLLLCIGPLEPHKGHRDAIWAFDILKYLYDDVHLALVGTGSDRDRLVLFAENIQALDRVHFPGPQSDITPWLLQAQVVWVPSLADGGINAALEGMAAGRPVVASNLAGLAAVVIEGKTGFLVPPGDKVALARQTRQLLDDPALASRLGAAAQDHVRERYSTASMVDRFIRLYDGS